MDGWTSYFSGSSTSSSFQQMKSEQRMANFRFIAKGEMICIQSASVAKDMTETMLGWEWKDARRIFHCASLYLSPDYSSTFPPTLWIFKALRLVKKLFTFTAFNIHWLFDMEKFPSLLPPRPSFLIRINDFIVRSSFYTWTKQQKNRPLL